MRRGSTPTNTFTLDVDLSTATVYITYEQNGKTVLEKTGEDLTFTSDQNGYYIAVTLSQEETLKFSEGKVLIQIRYVFPNGTADASNIIQTTFERIIKDGVIP